MADDDRDETTPPAAEVAPDEQGPAAARFGSPGQPFRRGPFYIGLVGGLGALTAYFGAQAILSALNILVLVFIAIFFAVGLHPSVNRLRGWGLPRGLAVAVVGLAVLLVLCGGLFALVPPLVGQVEAFVQGLPENLDTLARNPLIRDLTEQYDVVERAKAAVTPENLTKAFGGVLGGLALVFGTIFNILTVVLLTLYFLAAFDRMKSGAYRLAPASRRERVQAIGDEILTKVGAYIGGALFIALLAGATTFLFTLAAGIPYPVALAIVVAIFDLIPQVGATLGALVVILVGFVTSVPVGIAAVVFFVLYQQLENWIIYPRVMARAVRVSDLAAIVSALLGVALLGIVGALIAIPACAALQLIVREIVIPRQDKH